jgi:hypothetical protein
MRSRLEQRDVEALARRRDGGDHTAGGAAVHDEVERRRRRRRKQRERQRDDHRFHRAGVPVPRRSVTSRSPAMLVQRSRWLSGHCTTTAVTADDEPSPKWRRTSLADR